MSGGFEARWRAEMREHGIPEDKIMELWHAGRRAGRKAGMNATEPPLATETRDVHVLGLGVTYEGHALDPTKVTLHYSAGHAPDPPAEKTDGE